MANPSEYNESLPSGGKLIVRETSWFIHYYFSGPDLRHNGEIVEVKSKMIDDYIDAFISNYNKWESLKSVIPAGGEFECIGMCDMGIRIGKFYSGVNIAKWYNHLSGSCFPINSKEKLDQVISDYRYCKKRAIEVQGLLYK